MNAEDQILSTTYNLIAMSKGVTLSQAISLVDIPLRAQQIFS